MAYIDCWLIRYWFRVVEKSSVDVISIKNKWTKCSYYPVFLGNIFLFFELTNLRPVSEIGLMKIELVVSKLKEIWGFQFHKVSSA